MTSNQRSLLHANPRWVGNVRAFQHRDHHYYRHRFNIILLVSTTVQSSYLVSYRFGNKWGKWAIRHPVRPILIKYIFSAVFIFVFSAGCILPKYIQCGRKYTNAEAVRTKIYQGGRSAEENISARMQSGRKYIIVDAERRKIYHRGCNADENISARMQRGGKFTSADAARTKIYQRESSADENISARRQREGKLSELNVKIDQRAIKCSGWVLEARKNLG